jgi:hypothetical protein
MITHQAFRSDLLYIGEDSFGEANFAEKTGDFYKINISLHTIRLFTKDATQYFMNISIKFPCCKTELRYQS